MEQESEEKLQQQSQQYEERLTELHSIIAELSQRLDLRKNTVIQEEDEDNHEEDKGNNQG